MEAIEIINNLNSMKTDRANLDQEINECAQYACPEKAFLNQSEQPESNVNQRPRYINTDDVSDANSIMGRGLYSNLCPPNMCWFAYEAENKKLNKVDVVTSYYGNATSVIYSLIMNSNFSMEMCESFLDIGYAGIINVYLEKDEKRAYNFKNIPYPESYIRENNKGRIDTVYRIFKMTARQILQEYNLPDDSIPEEIKNEAEKTDYNTNSKRYTIIHAVEPNLKRKFDEDGKPLPGNKNMPYMSIYVCVETKTKLRDSGYDYNPYSVARFEKKSGSVYGFSPARSILRTAKANNKAWSLTFKTAEKIIDPVTNLDSRCYDKKSIKPQYYTNPAAVNMYDGSSGNPPQYAPVPTNLPFSDYILTKFQKSINAAYFVDMFQMLTQLNQDTKTQRTAFEISQLVGEKHSMIIPVVSRILEELFTALLRNCFYLAETAGLLGTKPSQLEGQSSLNITFVSPLALSTRMGDINKFNQAMQVLAPFMELQPDIVDWINLDKVTQDVLAKVGINPDLIRTSNQVKAMRELRMKQQQQAAAAQQQMDLAKSQDLTKPIAENSVASKLAAGM